MKTIWWIILIVVVVVLIGGAILLSVNMTGKTIVPNPNPSPSTTETVAQTENTGLGTIMTDTNGRALYVFLADTSGASTCYNACASAWPPLLVSYNVNPVGTGTDATLGVMERTDGTYQVTANGMPLYYFSGDSSLGDINGQGVNAYGALWYAVSPSGQQITTSLSGTTSASSGTASSSSSGETYSVAISNYAFSPSVLSVSKGDTVTWTNMDSVAHTVTSDSGAEMSSSSISPGQTYSHTFNVVGTYHYHCSIHTSMKGTVMVTDNAGGGASSGGGY